MSILPKPRVLVVEDDRPLVQVLTTALEGAGYRVIEARDGASGLQLAKKERPDLVLLDVELPDSEGFEICRAIRSHQPDLPVLMLTGRVEVEDRVTGLDAGADDYLAKPFDKRELLARMNALLRRQGRHLRKLRSLRIGPITVDLEKRIATRNGGNLALTKTEFSIIDLLAKHDGRPVGRDAILAAVWGYARLPTTRTIDTHIWRLRKKLGDDGKTPRWITMTPGQGYCLYFEPIQDPKTEP